MSSPATAPIRSVAIPASSVALDAPLKVMIVDDQAMIAEAVRRMLASQADLSLVACLKGAEAVERARAEQPDVILQDLVMPDADGLDLVRAYRADAAMARVPLIVLSTKEDAATKAEAFARGANDYLVKLPDPVELVARIRYHARVNRAQVERDRAFDALRAELESAAAYVRRLIPAPITGSIETHWEFLPSASLGGDAFGYRWIDDTHFAIYLLDVCGHGVGPALLGVSVMNALGAGVVAGADPGDPGAVLTALNVMYPMSMHNGMFFTLWYGVIDITTHELRYGCGGHPPVLLRLPDGAFRLLGGEEEVSGLVMGAIKGLAYQSGSASVPAGSHLMVYSDGIHELQPFVPAGAVPPLGVRPIEEFLEVGRAALDAAARQGVAAVEPVLAEARAYSGRADFDDDVSVLHIVVR
ncbi:MAG: SpoIIE family protein phosphatase [Planctomycetota bacterium]|nr:SpoIIE family protein phosphatase [Planctomycetota bacterium]MDA1106512.1 SpoIIE family protein phosphatase [Planctomycetota bacterium]